MLVFLVLNAGVFYPLLILVRLYIHTRQASKNCLTAVEFEPATFCLLVVEDVHNVVNKASHH